MDDASSIEILGRAVGFHTQRFTPCQQQRFTGRKWLFDAFRETHHISGACVRMAKEQYLRLIH